MEAGLVVKVETNVDSYRHHGGAARAFYCVCRKDANVREGVPRT